MPEFGSTHRTSVGAVLPPPLVPDWEFHRMPSEAPPPPEPDPSPPHETALTKRAARRMRTAGDRLMRWLKIHLRSRGRPLLRLRRSPTLLPARPKNFCAASER